MPCDNATFRNYDALLVSTAHAEFKDPALYADVPLVIDTRELNRRPGSQRKVEFHAPAPSELGVGMIEKSRGINR